MEKANPAEATTRSTRQTIEAYFEALRAGAAWQDHLADDVVFASQGTPAKRVVGRGAVVASTKGFYGMIERVAVQDILIDGQRACALTRYRLRPPVGEPFDSEVAEVFRVANGRIAALSIYFDSAPYPG
jgi:ketosteroid isomerase-like protein